MKPRLAESPQDLWKVVTEKTESGIIFENYGVLYPVVRTLGDGDYEIRRSTIKRLYDGGITYKNASIKEYKMLEKAINADTVQVELMSRWGGSGRNPIRRTVKVLHSPSGLHWKKQK